MSFLKQVLSMESASNAVSITTEELLDSFEAVYSAENAVLTFESQSEQLINVLNKVDDITQLSLESALTDKEYNIAMSVATDGAFDDLSMEADGDPKLLGNKKTIWQRVLEVIAKIGKWFKEQWSKFTSWTERVGEKMAIRFTKLTKEEEAAVLEGIFGKDQKSLEVTKANTLKYTLVKVMNPKLFSEFEAVAKKLQESLGGSLADLTAAVEAHQQKNKEVEDYIKENQGKETWVQGARAKFITNGLISKAIKEAVLEAKANKLKLKQVEKGLKDAEATLKSTSTTDEEKKEAGKVVTTLSMLKNTLASAVSAFWKALVSLYRSIFKKEKVEALPAPTAE